MKINMGADVRAQDGQRMTCRAPRGDTACEIHVRTLRPSYRAV